MMQIDSQCRVVISSDHQCDISSYPNQIRSPIDLTGIILVYGATGCGPFIDPVLVVCSIEPVRLAREVAFVVLGAG